MVIKMKHIINSK